MESDEYKSVTCSINGQECSAAWDCSDCNVGAEEEKRLEEQRILDIIDMCVKMTFCDVPVVRNKVNSVAVMDEETFKKIPGENVSSTPHTYGQYVKQDYPDFALLKDRLGLGTPNEVLRDVGEVAVFKYPGKVYICSPFCE